MPTGTTTARTQTRAKAAAKPIKDAPVDEQTPAAEPNPELAEPTTLPVQNLIQLVQDLQTAQDSDHDAIVGLSGEIGSTNRALKNVIEQLQEIAQFRKTAPEGVEQELGLEQAIDAAMIRIMRDVTAVGKDANAPAKMGGYAYRKVDDIMNAVGTSMRAHGVFIRPEVVANERKSWQSNGSLVTEVVLTMRYHWVSGVDGTSFSVLVVGEGRDNGDKATSKAQAMCYKTMLLQAMCIPLEDVTGFDVEREDTSGMVPDRPRQQATAYGYGHQPAESPGGRAHGQAQQAPPPPPEREVRQETPEEQAVRALAAARNANDLATLDRIENHARDLRIMDTMVEQAQLKLHLVATRGVLSGGMPGPAAETTHAQPPNEPPWDGPLDGRNAPGEGR
jgi:ERF superfamily protein